MKKSLPFRLRRIVNEYGGACLCCGRMTLNKVNGIPVCIDCEDLGVREARKEARGEAVV
jgi:hypothetical protein